MIPSTNMGYQPTNLFTGTQNSYLPMYPMQNQAFMQGNFQGMTTYSNPIEIPLQQQRQIVRSHVDKQVMIPQAPSMQIVN